MTQRALREFMSLPVVTRALWVVAALQAFSLIIRALQ
jgi:hypothetical protein